jgi:hypothetical protein
MQILLVVAHKQLAIDQENISFDAGEPAFEGVAQRPSVEVVIVGVSMSQRFDDRRLVAGATEIRGERKRNETNSRPRRSGHFHILTACVDGYERT